MRSPGTMVEKFRSARNAGSLICFCRLTVLLRISRVEGKGMKATVVREEKVKNKNKNTFYDIVYHFTILDARHNLHSLFFLSSLSRFSFFYSAAVSYGGGGGSSRPSTYL